MLLPSSAEAWRVAVAVMQQDRVVMATPQAQHLGVRRGMKRSSAAAVAPQVVLVERDPAREQSELQAAALALLQYTPEVAHCEDDVILLKVDASLRVFKGPRALCRRVRHTLSALGLQARLGMAPSAGGAWLLARRSGRNRRRRVLRLSSLQRQLNQLPCLLLPAARGYRDWLQDIGCRTLGGLERLPRAELQRRTSPQLITALDQAYGRATELFQWVQPPPVFEQRIELLERIEHAAAALFGARRLVEQLCGWLSARHLAASQVQLALEHERGRHARPPSVLPIRLAQPTWEAAHLMRLLSEKLPRLELPAPVIALRLSAPHVVPADASNIPLFADEVSQRGDQQRLLELLAARLGAEHVLRPAPKADYRPEVANQWVSALLAQSAREGRASAGGSTRVAQPNGLGLSSSAKAARQPEGARSLSAKASTKPAGRAASASAQAFVPPNVRLGVSHPFWLLDHPVPLSVHEGRPVYGSVLRLIRGPERIEVGWWDGPLIARDYFVAEDNRAVRYWVFRQRDVADAGWYLHGLFA